MSARDNILARIRAKQGKPPAAQADELDAVNNHVAAHPQGPRPRMQADVEARFCERALSLATTVDEIAAEEEIPAAAARYLRTHQLPMQAACWPQYAALDWAAQGLQVEARPATGSDLVGIGGVFCAIAETGTLMLLSGGDTHAVTSLLPETHIAVVPRRRIVAGMEDAWALLRAKMGGMPRAVNFVSGPSRTADIEQTVTLGAHGPYRVHLLLID